MAHKFSIETGIVFLELSGDLNARELFLLGDVSNRIEIEADRSPHRLVDFTETSGIDLDYHRLQEFATRHQEKKLKNPIRTALVAPEPLQDQFARAYISLSPHPMIERRIFTKRADALQWLQS